MKLLRGNLFNRNTLADALTRAPEPGEEQQATTAFWIREVRDEKFAIRSESQLEQACNEKILRHLLGYREGSAEALAMMQPEHAIGPGTVNLALGEFAGCWRAARFRGQVRTRGFRHLLHRRLYVGADGCRNP